MPYTYPNDVPDYIKTLPVGAQKVFVNAFNSELSKSSDETSARKAGWGAVKTKFKKSGDKWVKKTLSVQIDNRIEKSDIPGNLPDDLLELPGRIPEVWAMLFNQLFDKGVSVPKARDIAWSSIKKYVFWNGEKSKWFFKKLAPEEKILMKAMSNESSIKDEGMHRKHQIFKSGGKNSGDFKLILPINFQKSADEDGTLHLKGIASANKLDRENEMMMPDFIKKMRASAVGLPVFVDHIRKDSHMVGNVVGLETDNEEIFDPITSLEDPEENSLVKRLVSRMEKGVTYGYSIGGRITKAVKTFDKAAGGFIRKIFDGEIFEVSVVPVPALEGTDVFLFSKDFDDSSFVDFSDEDADFAKEIGIEDIDEVVKLSGSIVKNKETEWSELFWFMFEKAVDRFAESASQPKLESLDLEEIEKDCFLVNDGERDQ